MTQRVATSARAQWQCRNGWVGPANDNPAVQDRSHARCWAAQRRCRWQLYDTLMMMAVAAWQPRLPVCAGILATWANNPLHIHPATYWPRGLTRCTHPATCDLVRSGPTLHHTSYNVAGGTLHAMVRPAPQRACTRARARACPSSPALASEAVGASSPCVLIIQTCPAVRATSDS